MALEQIDDIGKQSQGLPVVFGAMGAQEQERVLCREHVYLVVVQANHLHMTP